MGDGKEVGIKNDFGKARWSLMLWPELRKILQIMEYGDAKYPTADNWKRVPAGRRRYFEACLRHLLAWYEGEPCDEESGYSHLAHAGCCILFLLWIDNSANEVDHPGE